MERFQIRDDHFGLALVDAATAEEALLTFVGRVAADELRDQVTTNDQGVAEVLFGPTLYRAVPAA